MTKVRIAAIKERIDAIAAKNGGRISADLAVRDAEKDHTSPFYEDLDWDDKTAGHSWRCEQARKLIARVDIEIVDRKVAIVAPRYVRDQRCAPNEQGYVSTIALKTDKEAAMEALVYECKRAVALMTRARRVAAVLGLSNKVEKILSDLEALAVSG